MYDKRASQHSASKLVVIYWPLIMLLTSAKQQHENPENGEPTNATVDSCFGLFGPRQCGVAPGVDQLLADVLLILFGTYTCMGYMHGCTPVCIHVEPTNTTADSYFDLFGPRQCGVAPEV